MTHNESSLSPNKQALLKIRELKQQLADAQESTGEPIAIVSMACRFPRTADTPEKFWQSLVEQQDLVGEIPDDRWDLEAFFDENAEVPGKMYARKGVFLENIDQMDPEFFGISPREATWVDPQQRLLMEVGWEAIERAGWLPEEIGESTGVFVGWMHNDYQNEASDSFLNLNPYIATGAAGSFLCGRLAYYLGLQGPSVAVDTACSSSLVALHLAIQSLQRRDCDRALVGGVNAICSPTTNILTCKLKALSPSGHSRAFDAAADGYLRGEGCGVVTLRRLNDAERDGDSILGIIRGSAIGHNGFSSGLTAPNPKAQEKVIRQALERAEIDAAEVGYLEAHGTGTELGDPIEVTAAAAAYCERRSADNPLLIGSVKTNIGHLEAAAGMAGLIKVLLSMQKDSIPGQMNFETPNPHIPWDSIPVKVLTEPTAWPNPARRIAGVSAFGMSGTNAHIIIESAVPQDADQTPTDEISEAHRSSAQESSPAVITLSGKNEEAVFELAAAYANSLASDQTIPLADFAWSTNVSRSHFEHRAAIATGDRDQAIQALSALGRGSRGESILVANRRRPPRVGWQFTGQGAQYVGMGRKLYDSEPVYREAIDFCDSELQKLRSGSLISVLFNDESEDPAINNTHWTQPATFALQMGLAKLMESWSLRPDFVLGHSVGQYAAACVAGVMSWEDGLRLIAERGRLIGELPPGGRMLALFAPEVAVREAISNVPGVSLAALNGTHIVISGEVAAIDQIESEFKDRGVRTKQLTTSHAFHSHLMDPVLEPFAQIADEIDFSPPTMPLICNVLGAVLSIEQRLSGSYWADHIRKPVAFAPSIESLGEMNCELLVELGPQSVLTRMAAASWKQPAETLVSCLRKDEDDHLAVISALAAMYVQGANPDFHQMPWNAGRRKVDLPTYPFQRRRFWGPDKPRAAHAEYHTAHPLLGSKISLAGVDSESRFEGFIDVDSPSWMPDHEVMNATVLPGAAFVEMAIEAAADRVIENVVFEQPLRPSQRTALQTVVKPVVKSSSTDDTETSAGLKLETYSALPEGKNWTRHFTCELVEARSERPAPVDPVALGEALTETGSPSDFYQKMSSLGLNYGPAFQCIQEIQFSESEVLTRLQVNGDVRGYTIPPTLLDAALHSLAVGLLQANDDNLFLPVGMGRVECYGDIESEAWCHAKWKVNEGPTRTADLLLFSDRGDVLLRIDDLKVQQVSLAALRQMSGAGAERLVFELNWKPTRLTPARLDPKNWLVVSSMGSSESKNSIASKVSKLLEEKQHRVHSVQLRAEAPFTQNPESEFEFCGRSAESWERLLDSLSDENGNSKIDGVTWLLDSSPTETESASGEIVVVMNFVKSMVTRQWRRLPCGFQMITRNAIDIGGDNQAVEPEQTKFWGLGRVIGAEQPELRCRLLDLETAEPGEQDLAVVVELALTETEDNQHAIRSGQLFVPRMSQGRLRKSTRFAASADGCYLITGGLGKLGRQNAKWLADRGAGQVVLVSRREPDDEARDFISEIEQSGCSVVVHSADIGSQEDVVNLFANFGVHWKRLAGVVHAAGVLDDGLIESQTAERFEKVLRPKTVAAKLLDEATRELDLDLFVLYSSAASVLGSPGQSNYATGNAFLDGLAYQRRHRGLPALAINWGPWTEGMADDERILKRLALQGITPLGVEEAHNALEKMLANDTVQATVIDVDWRKMRTGPNGDVPALLRDLVGSRKKSAAVDSALVSKLKQLPGPAQRDLLVKTIRDSLQGILSTPELPETDRPLIEMGLDSLMAVEFGTELQQMLGDQFNVGPTMLFDHPTIDAISDHVLELITQEGGDAPAPAEERPARSTASNDSFATERDDIAIIGLSCRFPGAQNAAEFWQNLLDGVDSVRDIPHDRWDIDRFYSAEREPGKMYTRQGGFLEDIADFDAAFFNISEQEACWIDPQHRMLLENSYRALEDAGIPTSPISDSNVGVFMGIMGSDYAFLPTLDDEDIIKGFQGAGLSHSAGVGRISYLFGFEGPSVAVDTASSSSLVAVYQAMRSLQEGNCNLALAGGVNAILAPVNSLLMSKAGLLSPDGRCKSFSKSADGFGRGEGCGVFVLKRLKDAERDGDRIMAVIRGGAVVHNGFSGGITSPSGKAQSRVIDAAIKDAQIAPSQVQYLEAHGTGTEYGDPMEMGAAIKIYGKGRSKQQPLLVGSVKPNISHLEAAGGSSGLVKTVLSLYHRKIPQTIHFDEPSPHIPWKRMPVQMVTENSEWPECERPTAGVTALGLVGTNAHLIVSAPESSPTDKPETHSAAGNNGSAVNESSDQLLVLSARCEKALSQLCADYSSYLQAHPDTDLGDLCYTAGAGRRHFEYRMAVQFGSREELLQQLSKHAKPNPAHSNGNGAAHVPATPVHGASKLTWVFGDASLDSRPRLKELVESYPVVAEFVDGCQRRLQDSGAIDENQAAGLANLEDLIHEPASSEQHGQLLEYLVQASLAKLWEFWGIQPDTAFGFGVGQYTAACVAGCLCFFDALVLVAERERLLDSSADAGAWVEFEKLADGFNFYPPNLPLICSVSGEVVPVHRSLGGSYWKSQATAEWKLPECLDALSKQDGHVLVIGGIGDIDSIADKLNKLEGEQIYSTSEKMNAIASLQSALGRLYKLGCQPNFSSVFADKKTQPLSLPCYPFQKKRYWITEISKFMESEKTLKEKSVLS